MAIRYIVVPKQLSTAGDTPEQLDVPAALTRALGSQLDLRVLPSDPALDVYENVSWGGARALLTEAGAAAVRGEAGTGADLSGSLPVLGGAGPVRFSGDLPSPGTVLVSEAPSGRWELTVGGDSASRVDAFGVANAFTAGAGGPATASYRTPLYRWPLAVLPFLLWACAANLLWRSRARPAPREDETQLMPILTAAGAR